MLFGGLSFLASLLAASLAGTCLAADVPVPAGGDPVSVSVGVGVGGGGKKPTAGEPGASSTSSSKSNPTQAPITGGGEGTSGSSKIITIVVGSTVLNKSLVFTPANVKAAPGDILQFQFSQINHTVTQSTFNEPCQPIQQSDPTAAGIHSGFIPVTGNSTTVQTFDVPVNDTKPLFIYCAQGPHCQLGMVMTVNAEGTENFTAYKALAAKATSNIPAKDFKGGVLGSIPATSAAKPPT